MVQASSLNTNEFRMSTVNRQQSRGGGLALIHNKEIKVKLKNKEEDDPSNLENGKPTETKKQ